MKRERRARLFRAVLRRISDAGDMAIRIRGATLAAIVQANGMNVELWDASGYREVEAIALEALILRAEAK